MNFSKFNNSFPSHTPTTGRAKAPAIDPENLLIKFYSDKLFVSTREEGYFAVLMDELRHEVFKFLEQDKDFANACRVNKRWLREITLWWQKSGFVRGLFNELEFWLSQGRDWKWVIRCKVTKFSENDSSATGIGFIEDSNGRYEGEWKSGKREGLGKKINTDKSFYIGNWKDSKKHGFGIFVWEDGTRYEGGWKEDKYDGFGRKAWENKDVYEGNWLDDKKHGHGIYIWGSGDKYEGQWESDIQSGEGTMLWAGGDKYVGGFKNNMFEGKGVYFYEVGDRYEGEWKANDRSGFAKYFYKYGGVYEGNFKADERNGLGTFYWPDGAKFHGHWKNGSRFGGGFFNPKNQAESIPQTWTDIDEPAHANYSTNIPRQWPDHHHLMSFSFTN